MLWEKYIKKRERYQGENLQVQQEVEKTNVDDTVEQELEEEKLEEEANKEGPENMGEGVEPHVQCTV